MSKRITPKNVLSFVMGYSLASIENIVDLPKHITEQINYRKKVCSDCLKQGECPVCHCKLPEKFYAYHPCEGKKYPALMTKKEWLQSKKELDP